ncbi:MAG: bifunctional phosphopantothenoylcysteine decarboxylase/phosphopantothenate--cysteine ligase CoaBC [Acidilobaceae archaeon]
MEISPYHPVRSILGSTNRYLEGMSIILGLTGSVAAYKAVDTARWLIRRGAKVIPVMTTEATKYVGPILLHWATGFKPIVELTGETEHVGLVRVSDSILVAPATLSTMSKIAYGIADNPVALVAISALGYGKKVIIAPAMHESLYEVNQYKKVAGTLEEIGAKIIPPLIEEGVAKYPDPELVARVAAAHTSRGIDMKGLRALVTAGPTREWIDNVRFISNPSSGKMGLEVAVEAWSRGAIVDLVYGHIAIEPPHFINKYKVDTTIDMAETIAKLTEKNEYDVIVAAAAPVDFTPSEKYEGKIKSGLEITLNLKPTVKVLESIRGKPRALIAFAAEHTLDEEKLYKAAVEKLVRYKANIVIANPVGFPGTGFEYETNRAIIAYSSGEYRNLGLIHKEILSRLILDEALKIIGKS